MKRLISFLLLPAAILFLPVLSRAQSNCPSFSPVDVFMNFNGATPGTPANTTNLASSTEGTYSSWVGVSSNQTFAASQVALPAAVSVVGGSTHSCGFATQAMAQFISSSIDLNFSQIDFLGNAHSVVVISGWVSNLPPDASGSGALMDLTDILSSGTHNAVMQLVHGTGNNCSSYGTEIEAPQNGVAHSNCNNSTVPGGTYYYSMIINWTATGNCGAGEGGAVVEAPCAGEMYFTTNGSTFTQVGPTVAVSLGSEASGDHLLEMFFGQDENGVCSGTTAQCTLYFQNTMVAWTYPVWPNIPQNGVNPPTNLNATLSVAN
jgi:hypothetical protein